MLDVSTFAYDSAAPLDLIVVSEELRDSARIQDIA
jgi:hypothetical protein